MQFLRDVPVGSWFLFGQGIFIKVPPFKMKDTGTDCFFAISLQTGQPVEFFSTLNPIPLQINAEVVVIDKEQLLRGLESLLLGRSPSA
jgi:hypothetical protein